MSEARFLEALLIFNCRWEPVFDKCKLAQAKIEAAVK